MAGIALASASHTGTVAHVEAIRGFAARYEIDPDDLRCSSRAPLDGDTTRSAYSRLENECSGEHVGALALARRLRVPPATYLDADGMVQAWYGESVEEALPRTSYQARLKGRDGCGMPSVWGTLSELASAYAQLSMGTSFGGLGQLVTRAVRAEPALFSGQYQYVYGLITESEGEVLAKAGADGLYAAWWPDLHVGAVTRAASGFHGAAAVCLQSLAAEAALPFPMDAPYYLGPCRVMQYSLL